MSWTQIIGYEREKKILQKAILERKIANAYCFMGQEGIGKEAVAIQFAKSLNCENPVITEDSYDSCDKCGSCKRISGFSHQNFDFIFALPASGKADAKGGNPLDNLSEEQIEEIKSEISKKADNNYYKIQIPNASQIKISSIRYLKKKLTLSDTGRGRRVVGIASAEQMTEEASNSFLKTLEEPSSNITIILITSQPNRILPTILSRCQQINFGPLSDELIVKALMQRDRFALEDAMLAAAFGQGSYIKALHSVDEEMLALRENMISLLRLSVKKRNYRLKMIEEIDELIKTNDKNKLHSALLLLQFLLRDAELLSKKSDRGNIINTDKFQMLDNFVSHYGDSELYTVIVEIENAASAIFKNVNKHLIFLRLFMKIREILMVKKF